LAVIVGVWFAVWKGECFKVPRHGDLNWPVVKRARTTAPEHFETQPSADLSTYSPDFEDSSGYPQKYPMYHPSHNSNSNIVGIFTPLLFWVDDHPLKIIGKLT
jgi:hypothetical protein